MKERQVNGENGGFMIVSVTMFSEVNLFNELRYDLIKLVFFFAAMNDTEKKLALIAEELGHADFFECQEASSKKDEGKCGDQHTEE